MPWKQRLPVFLYLLTKPTTPEICDIFCLHYRQDESHSSFLERAWETVWTPNPSPHTPEGPWCTGIITFLEGLPCIPLPSCPGALQGPRKPSKCYFVQRPRWLNHSLRPAGPHHTATLMTGHAHTQHGVINQLAHKENSAGATCWAPGPRPC